MNKTARTLAIALTLVSLLFVSVVLKEHYINRLWRRFAPRPNPAIEQLIQERIESEEYAQLTRMLEVPCVDSVHITVFGDSQTARGNWNILLKRLDIINLGIPGDITPAMVARIGEVVALKPKICFIQAGVNDINVGISNDQITLTAFQTIIDRLNKHHIRPVLHTIAYVSEPYNQNNPINERIACLNEKIKSLANENKVDLIDLNPFIALDQKVGTAYLLNDGVHYSFDTYLLWSSCMQAILMKYSV